MIFKTQNSILSVEKLLSLKRPYKVPSGANANTLLQNRWITRVRLKWVKNRGLDHIIDIDTDLKAACLLKDAIKRSSTGFLTANSVSDWHKLLGLTVPVIRFLRRFLFFHFFLKKIISLMDFHIPVWSICLVFGLVTIIFSIPSVFFFLNGCYGDYFLGLL